MPVPSSESQRRRSLPSSLARTGYPSSFVRAVYTLVGFRSPSFAGRRIQLPATCRSCGVVSFCSVVCGCGCAGTTRWSVLDEARNKSPTWVFHSSVNRVMVATKTGITQDRDLRKKIQDVEWFAPHFLIVGFSKLLVGQGS